MLSAYRKNNVIRALVLTAMVWGFAVPVVHLVCGMAAEAETVLCADHYMDGGMHDTATMAEDMAASIEAVVTGETGDSAIECCWIDANAVDRRAPLPALTQLPDFTAAHSELFAIRVVQEARTLDRSTDAESPPPVAFRLLFSVFLI